MQTKNIIELLKEIAPTPKCQICGHDDWTIWFDNETILNPTVTHVHGKNFYSLSCDHCGNTVFLRKNIIDKKLLGYNNE